MRPSLLPLCLITLLMLGCSTAGVTTTPNASQAAQGPATPVRNDRAPTAPFPPADSDGYRPPAQLAVLLPMSGTLAPASASVRDGLLAAYYNEGRRRPTIKFYDTLGTGTGAQAAATRAIAEGAQMIVGPLTREEVNAVLAQANGQLPMIALNRGSAATPAGTTSFALLPDEEGAAAANRLADRGLLKALVISNRSDQAQRAVAAFRDALRKRGGDVVSEVPVAGEMADLNTQLAALLVGPAPPNAVFLALDSGQARAIAAQLKTSALAGLPRIATSLMLSGGNGGVRAESELDGIEYPELPWLLEQAGALPDAAALAKALPTARGSSQRLFAFGADAWKLTAYFERLYNDPAFSISGATGQLRIDVAGPVQRTLAWAVMSGGRGRPSPDVVRPPDAQPASH